MITLLKRAAAAVATPAAGKLTLWADAVSGLFKTKDENGLEAVLGNGIVSVQLISTVGLVKTYRINYLDGTSTTFAVSDGAQGPQGVQGIQGPQGVQGPTGPQGAAGVVQSVNGISQAAVVLNTGNIAEGSNLYYTNARADLRAATAIGQHVALPDPHNQYRRKRAIFYDAEDYGALVSGSAGGTVAGAQAAANRTTLQAAIAAAAAGDGGIVLVPAGVFHVDQTLTINSSGVVLFGAGGLSTADVGSQTPRGTTLFWNSGAAASSSLVEVVTVAGGNTQPVVKRSGVANMNLQCAGAVAWGLRVRSVHFGIFENLYIINPAARGIWTECLVTGVDTGEAADVTKCVFDNISIRLLEAPNTAVGLYLDGASNANTSNSTFRNVAVSCLGAQLGLDCRNTDSNRFYDLTINQSNGGTVQPVRLRGGSAAGLEARGNVFFYLAAGGSSTGLRGLYSEGTETAGVVAPAKNNVIYGYSIENGEPYPVIGVGSTLLCEVAGGAGNNRLAAAVLADTAFSNVAATVASLTLPANSGLVGDTFDLFLAGSVINTTTATNLVVDVLVNGTVAATVTLALGATAFAAPGRGFMVEGALTIRSTGAAGSVSTSIVLTVNGLASIVSNPTAAPAVNFTAGSTIALRIATSGATSTGTIRQGFVRRSN